MYVAIIEQKLWFSEIVTKQPFLRYSSNINMPNFILSVFVTEHSFVCTFEIHKQYYMFFSIYFVATRSNIKTMHI